jgi:rSAM/selenodomain-associated transferase 2
MAVIIPVLNEEATIRASIGSAREAGADEIVVSDGGSRDGSLALARELGVRVIDTERSRARQLNVAARATDSEILLFLHADTTLPDGARSLIEQALDGGAIFGGFRLRFLEDEPRLRVCAAMINFRTLRTRCPWGDQAQFTTRAQFERVGGYPDMPIMEDYEMARRMRASGPTAVLPAHVLTSGRRFLEKGVLATAVTNWKIITAYHLGVSPAELRKMYGSRG